MLAQLQADGVILMTNTGEKSQSYEAVSMPIVFVDRRLDEMGQTSVIEADHYAGGKLAAEYLIACGCRQITCIRGPQELSSGKKRYEGYREVCRQHSMKERFVDSTYKYEDGCLLYTSHLYYMVVRTKTGEAVNIDLNEFVQEKYPEAMKIAALICDNMAEKLERQIMQEEVGFLAIHIQRMIAA